ncbi:MAG: family 20 glycosylhydrolase, partial [Thermoguttaceae bacterium]|nr:family 20 glycosylhydrolase [Thermoguttaceae bacterium]
FFKQTNAYRCLAVGDKRIPDDAKPEEFVERQDELTGTLLITASDLAGFRDSFKTLKQLAETFGVSATTEDSRRFIPELEIDDVPRLVFRGLHLCWFPETESTSIERSIRMASYYKFNYIVLEFWGVFPFEACDAMCWEEFHTSKDEVRRLVSLGRSLGVQLIPQINLLGHAPGARGASGKHTLLDNHPEMEPLFEPDGWTWNIYNPSTRDLLSKCVLELYETFDRPPYFHIGCDEAYSAGTSFVARRKGNYAEVLAEWITHFHDLLQERDCRIMMWHDMLIEPADFKGYTACGNAKTWGLIDKLPKDILLCDWQYDKPKENETWPTTSFFSEKGFEVLSCPWRNLEGIKSLAGNAAEKKYFGLLCTTWHTFYGVEMRNIFTVGTHSAWGTEYRGDDQLSAFNRHLRQANRDTVNKNYRTEGVNDWQVLKETYVPF